MTDFDVERMVEFEIEQLKEDIKEACEKMRPHSEIIELYVRLTDVLELRVQQLVDKIEDYRNEVTEY